MQTPHSDLVFCSPVLYMCLLVAYLQPGERQYPGQVYVDIGPLRTNLTFERRDSTVTLLKNDQVLINLLTDIVSEKRRATNIKPKIPATFSHTKETREKVSTADTLKHSSVFVF